MRKFSIDVGKSYRVDRVEVRLGEKNTAPSTRPQTKRTEDQKRAPKIAIKAEPTINYLKTNLYPTINHLKGSRK